MSHIYTLKTFLHNASGHFFQNVFHYELNETGILPAYGYARELMSAWEAAVEADYLACLGSDVHLDFLTAQRINGGGGPTATHIRNLTGTDASASISAGLCADILWINPAASHRLGHTFIGGFPDTYLLGDEWQGFDVVVAPFITAMTTALTLGGGNGTADFGMFTRKTGAFSANSDGELRPKPTLLNKRTVPDF